MNELVNGSEGNNLINSLRGVKIGSYQIAHIDKYLDFLERSNYGILDGLQPYADHLTKVGYVDRNGSKKRYTAASIQIMVAAATRVGDRILEVKPEAYTPVMELRWTKAKKDIKVPKSSPAVDEDRYLPWEEVQKLIAGTQNNKVRLLISFLAQSGCRISESLNIKVADLTKNGVCYRIRLIGKGLKERTVAVEIPLIEEILTTFESDTWLFEHNGKQFNAKSMTTRISEAAKAILGRSVSAHMLRHSWVTEQLAQGRSLNEVSKYIGHASVSTTADVYSHTALASEKAMLPIAIDDDEEDKLVTNKLNRALKGVLHEVS